MDLRPRKIITARHTRAPIGLLEKISRKKPIEKRPRRNLFKSILV
jgi:hypothetical protein